ncbi:MAG: murein hydrolase activator EnvC family protein, partial [bacterium]
LKALASATSQRMNSLEEDRRQLDAYRVEFDARYQGLRRSMSRGELTRRRVERERAGNERSLRRVRVGKARSEEAVRRLKAGADQLQGMLSALQREVLRRERAEEANEQAEARAESAQAQPAEGEAPSDGSGWSAPPRFRGQGLRRSLPWPVFGELLSRFGKHLHPIFHIPVFNRGIEIAAAFGSPVRVVSAGTVDYAGPLEGFGQLVVVDHGRGMLSVYGYGSRLLVREGQLLRRGDVVEDVGRAPDSGRASLYFEISRGAKPQNPLDYLARR